MCAITFENRKKIKLIFLLIAIDQVMCIGKQQGFQLHKCCPDNHELVIDDQADAGKFFNCNTTTSESATTDFFMHYNIAHDADTHIPQCVDPSDFHSFLVYDERVTLSVDSCFDMLGGNMYALTCKEPNLKIVSFNFEFSKIYRLRKCCPMNQFYDVAERMCVDENDRVNSMDRFEHLLDDSSSIFRIGSPKCENNEVLIEYHSTKHNLKVQNATLYVTSHRYSELMDRILPNSFCLDMVAGDKDGQTNWMAQACQLEAVCNYIPCIRKCCGVGEKLLKANFTTKCVPHPKGIAPVFHSFTPKASIVAEPTEYGVVHYQTCERYILMPEVDQNDVYHMNVLNGYLTTYHDGHQYHHDDYCVDNLNLNGEDTYRAFICFGEQQETLKTEFTIYAIGLLSSAIFLGITMIVYLSLPMLLNLHGKTLICHVGSLFCAFTILATIKLCFDVQIEQCVLFGYIIYFTFLTAFTWLNVMCFDIWWTFGSARSFGMRKKRELKRFLWYSLYAWGVPIVLLLITYLFDTYKLLPDDYLPRIGAGSCFFLEIGGPGHFIFFMAPVGIFIFSNCIFFVMTVIHCNKIKAEIHRMRDSNSNESTKKRFVADKAKLAMNIKLFIVMGVSWLLEVTATIFKEPKELWYLSDCFNCMQGLLVFIIFVCKRKVLNAIKKRLGIEVKMSRGTTVATGTTMLSSPGTKVRHDPLAVRYGPLLKKSSSGSLSSATILNVKR